MLIFIARRRTGNDVLIVAVVAQDIPGVAPDNLKYGIGAAAVIAVLIVLALLMRRGKARVDPEKGLSENLAAIPPAPGKPGKRRVTVHAQPMRLRLVILAPTGKRPISVEEAESLVGQMMRRDG